MTCRECEHTNKCTDENLCYEDGIRQGREDTKAECIEILNGIDKQVAEIVKGVWEKKDNGGI